MIIGIDYGRKKMGIAIADGPLAEPHSVIRVENFNDAVAQVANLVTRFNHATLVVGLSEGEMARESRKFGHVLEAMTRVPVVFQDETLSSWESQKMAIEAGKKLKKRKEMEDAYAAAVMLQNYLDRQ